MITLSLHYFINDGYIGIVYITKSELGIWTFVFIGISVEVAVTTMECVFLNDVVDIWKWTILGLSKWVGGSKWIVGGNVGVLKDELTVAGVRICGDAEVWVDTLVVKAEYFG